MHRRQSSNEMAWQQGGLSANADRYGGNGSK
jgi:hypothetical protein